MTSRSAYKSRHRSKIGISLHLSSRELPAENKHCLAMKAAVIWVLVLISMQAVLTPVSVSATPLRPEDVDAPNVDHPHFVVKRGWPFSDKIQDYEKYLLG